MKRILFLALMTIFAGAYAEDARQPNWRIVKTKPFFSTSAEFECRIADVLEAKLIRSGLFMPRYYYDLFDAHNNFLARGITRAFSFGQIFPWAMELDVYDSDGLYLGLIDGQTFTYARAKFMFYNPNGVATAIAYLNNEYCEFHLVSAFDESFIMAEMKGNAYGSVSVTETKLLKERIPVDDRVLKVFAAFITDYHDEFTPQPKVVHYFHYNNYNPNDLR